MLNLNFAHFSQIFHSGQGFDLHVYHYRGSRLDFFTFGVDDGNIKRCETSLKEINCFALCFLICNPSLQGILILFSAFFELGHAQPGAFRNLGFLCIGDSHFIQISLGIDKLGSKCANNRIHRESVCGEADGRAVQNEVCYFFLGPVIIDVIDMNSLGIHAGQARIGDRHIDRTVRFRLELSVFFMNCNVIGNEGGRLFPTQFRVLVNHVIGGHSRFLRQHTGQADIRSFRFQSQIAHAGIANQRERFSAGQIDFNQVNLVQVLAFAQELAEFAVHNGIDLDVLTLVHGSFQRDIHLQGVQGAHELGVADGIGIDDFNALFHVRNIDLRVGRELFAVPDKGTHLIGSLCSIIALHCGSSSLQHAASGSGSRSSSFFASSPGIGPEDVGKGINVRRIGFEGDEAFLVRVAGQIGIALHVDPDDLHSSSAFLDIGQGHFDIHIRSGIDLSAVFILEGDLQSAGVIEDILLAQFQRLADLSLISVHRNIGDAQLRGRGNLCFRSIRHGNGVFSLNRGNSRASLKDGSRGFFGLFGRFFRGCLFGLRFFGLRLLCRFLSRLLFGLDFLNGSLDLFHFRVEGFYDGISGDDHLLADPFAIHEPALEGFALQNRSVREAVNGLSVLYIDLGHFFAFRHEVNSPIVGRFHVGNDLLPVIRGFRVDLRRHKLEDHHDRQQPC